MKQVKEYQGRSVNIPFTLIAIQFVGYVFVGGLSTMLDIGGAWTLAKMGMPILLASAAGFTIGSFINYILSYRILFRRGRFSRREEVVRLFGVSLVGLALNTLFVWAAMTFIGAVLVVAKAIAIPIVLIWNFYARRILVFYPEPPNGEGFWSLLDWNKAHAAKWMKSDI